MPLGDFVKQEKIGNGTYSEVFRVIRLSMWYLRQILTYHPPEDQKQYVIKQIELSSIEGSERDACVKECRILSQFRHRYIIRYYESFISRSDSSPCEGLTPESLTGAELVAQSASNDSSSGGGDSGRSPPSPIVLNIVMEFCPYGTLADVLIRRKGRRRLAGAQSVKDPHFLDERLVKKYFCQILSALRHVHKRRIIHRDLKPSNVFLSKNHTCKLGDFGVSRILSHDTLRARTVIGTPYYLAPELCKNAPYTMKADVWSLGCVLYELCELTHPFKAKNHAALVLNIVKGRYAPISSKRYSQEVMYVLQKCLRKEEEYRYSTTQLMQMSIVQEWAREVGVVLAAEPTSSRSSELAAAAAAAPRPRSSVDAIVRKKRPTATPRVRSTLEPVKTRVRTNPRMRQKRARIRRSPQRRRRVVLGDGDDSPELVPQQQRTNVDREDLLQRRRFCATVEVDSSSDSISGEGSLLQDDFSQSATFSPVFSLSRREPANLSPFDSGDMFSMSKRARIATTSASIDEDSDSAAEEEEEEGEEKPPEKKEEELGPVDEMGFHPETLDSAARQKYDSLLLEFQSTKRSLVEEDGVSERHVDEVVEFFLENESPSDHDIHRFVFGRIALAQASCVQDLSRLADLKRAMSSLF